MIELRLQWQQIECRSCGAARHRAHRCDVCGARPDPREVDQRVARRRGIAARVADHLRDVSPSDTEALDRPPFDSLETFLDDFFSAAEKVVAEGTPVEAAEARLTEAVERVRWARSVATSARRRRPFIESWRTFDLVVEALDRVAELILTAMQMDRQIDGVRAAQGLQPAIDDAASALGELSRRLARADLLASADDPAEILITLLAEATREVAGDLLVLDEYGGLEIERRAGFRAPPGFGVAVAVISLQIDALFDPERFWSVVSAVVPASRPHIARATDDPAWDATFGSVDEKLRLAAWSYGAVADAARRTEDAVRAAMTLAADLVEGPGRRLLATALAAKGVQTLSRLERRDAGALLDIAKQHGMQPWLDGFELSLRNARFHDDYSIEEEVVTLADGSTWSPESLVDVLLAGIESALAIQLGLIVAALDAGVDIGKVSDYSTILPDPRSAAAAICTAWGWEELDIELLGDTLRIDAVADPTRVRAAMLASVASVVTSPDVSQLRIELSYEENHSVLAGPLAPYRAFARAEEDLQKGTHFVRVARTWTRDGKPLLDSDQVKKWVAVMVGPALSGGLRDRRRILTELTALAVDLDEPVLAAHLKRVSGAARTVDLGLPPLPEEQKAIEFFAQWEKKVVATPDI